MNSSAQAQTKGLHMVRSRRMLVSLVLAGLMVVMASVVVAAPGGNGKGNGKDAQNKARLTWSTARLEQTLEAGTSAIVEVSLTSSAELKSVSLRVPGGLGRIITKIEPSTFDLEAGKAKTVRFTLSMPAEGAHSQGGVVQAIVGRRNMPQSLKVLVKVPGDADASDDAGNAGKTKDDKRNNGKGQGNANGKHKSTGAAAGK